MVFDAFAYVDREATTESVREEWAERDGYGDWEYKAAQFDAWLAAHDAEVAQAALAPVLAEIGRFTDSSGSLYWHTNGGPCGPLLRIKDAITA